MPFQLSRLRAETMSAVHRTRFYSTSDSFDTVMASGYFSPAATFLITGDVINVYNTTTLEVKPIRIINTNGVITTAPIVNNTPYDEISGRSYLAGAPGNTTTSTNTTVIANNAIIAVPAFIYKPCTIVSSSVRTSSSSVSSGVTVKMGVYGAKADGTPDGLLAGSGDVAIGDSAQNTNYTGTFSTPLIITEPKKIFLALHSGVVTTGARFSCPATVSSFATVEGSSSITNALTALGICGYSGTSTFASGLPATFPTPTAITTNTDSITMAYTLA